MKTALILESMVIVALCIILAVKCRKSAQNEAQTAKFEMTPGDIELTPQVLERLGFKILNTKDQLYALHTTGVSLTYIEGIEWIAEISDGRRSTQKHVYYAEELILFANENKRELHFRKD